MRRFFVRPEEITGETILLTGPEVHHLRVVLRLQPGSNIELFDGTGTIYQAEVQNLTPDSIRGRIIQKYVELVHDPFPVTLAQGILKGKKMDVVVQKATELGVATLIPVLSCYCEAGKNLERRIDRWQRVVLESCKQCGRANPMRISSVQELADISVAAFPYPVFCWEKEKRSFLTPGYLAVPGQVLLLIGPEGGFNDQEVEWATDNNFQSVRLGPYVLRAETAALAAVSIVKYLGSLAGTDGDN
ncbi:MAG TPA: 16S rRNA (uracil(1498)-N(3))-methyltransferase [Desulfobulbaceae bacterium]|nr:16S rRNA (uracil(1498)-N(3))-methyltransferase [Desulfobulbaceae bacterium]